MGIWNDILTALGLQSASMQVIQPSVTTLSIVPTHVGSPFVAEEELTMLKPLTEEFIRECIDNVRFWAGYEEGRGEKLIALHPELLNELPETGNEKADAAVLRMLVNRLNYNFNLRTNPFIEIIDNAFQAATGENCSDKDLYHIYGNGINAAGLSLSLHELKSPNRQEVVNALYAERVQLLQETQGFPEFDFREDASHQRLIGIVKLGCFDKFTELLIGNVLAAQIVRDTNQEIAKQSSSPDL